jgi:hypothetical protein
METLRLPASATPIARISMAMLRRFRPAGLADVAGTIESGERLTLDDGVRRFSGPDRIRFRGSPTALRFADQHTHTDHHAHHHDAHRLDASVPARAYSSHR